MAAPSVNIAQDAYNAGCRATCIVTSSPSGEGYAEEYYEASVTAVAPGWRFLYFSWHQSIVNTSNFISTPSSEKDFQSDPGYTPVTGGHNVLDPQDRNLLCYVYIDATGLPSEYYGSFTQSISNLVAHFEQVAPTYLVTLDPQGGTGGTASVNAIYGSPMPLATMPARSGYRFNGYFTGTNGSGTKYYNADGTSARNWDLSSATTLYASWTENRYTISLYADPQGGGQVSFDGTNYQDVVSDSVSTPTTYMLYARPSAGWRFVKFEVPNTWSSTDNPKTYTLDTGYVDIRAVFEQTPVTYYTVTTQARYATGGIVAGGGTYAAGTVITLLATPNQGYQFSGWKSSAGSTESSKSFSYTVNSNVTWTAFFGTGLLIYFDRTGCGIDVPGDATVTIDFDPKLWTCEAYGQDHAVTLTVTPSWGSATTISAQTNPPIPLSKSTLEGGSTFIIGLDAITSCSAGIYPTVTAIIVVQQLNVGTFTLEVPLTVGTQSTATINASGGRITALN